MNRFVFLGTGASMGVPVVGCHCSVCQSPNPRNQRLRSAALVHVKDKTLLFDCGPDFRVQMLREKVDLVDGLVLTHAHYDHTGAFDELRIFCARTRMPIPCLLSQHTLDELVPRFPYVFDDKPSLSAITKVNVQLLKDDRGDTNFLGVPMRYMTYEQAGMLVNGFRIGNLAYISDISHYPESIFEDLAGIDTLIVSCLRIDPSPVHFNVEDAVAFTNRTGAKKAWFTHIAHEIEHDTINAQLPPHCHLAYDGLELDFML